MANSFHYHILVRLIKEIYIILLVKKKEDKDIANANSAFKKLE